MKITGIDDAGIYVNAGVNPDPDLIAAQKIFLNDLADNDQAIALDAGYLIPHIVAAAFSAIDKQLIGFPEPYPFDIVVNSRGTLNQGDFRFEYGFFEYKNGVMFNCERKGCILELDGGDRYTLSSDAHKLLDALDEFNSLLVQEKSFSLNLTNFASIKALSEAAGAVLDKYLLEQNVIMPEKLHIQIKMQLDGAELLPEIDGIDNNAFQKTFSSFPLVQTVYTVESEGHKIRLPANQKIKLQLEQIKKHRNVHGKQKEDIFEHPEEYFDPDVVDLDEFSERVIRIGYYKPKYYPFISPYRSEWLPGFIVEKPDGTRDKIAIKNQHQLESFQSKILEAQKRNDNSVEWHGFNIPIISALEIVEVARRQFEKPEKRVDTVNEKPVLIIYENVEQVDIGPKSDNAEITEPAIFHNFESVTTFNSNYNLLDHQKEGIAWLQALLFNRYSGGLLADDMGLGKTLQILYFIHWHNVKHNRTSKPYLIVAPLGLVDNWIEEFNRFFIYDMQMTCFYGDSKKIKFNESLQNKIVITTYETLRRNQIEFGKVSWAIVALDEAQKIKAPGTLVTNASKALKGDFKIASTGTPVENTFVDLWCIIDFIAPGLLGSAKDFVRKYQNPQKSQDVDIEQLGQQLRKRIGNYIKRRLKSEILYGLPKKIILELPVEMPKEQLARYEAEVAILKQLQNGNKSNMLRAIHNIRDISDHPFILDMQTASININRLINSSAKLQATINILKQIKPKDEKVIIFSDRKKTQQLLAKVVGAFFNIDVRIINGDTPALSHTLNPGQESRKKIIDEFQNKSGFNVLVISQLAAGVGFNIVEANHVIHYSRHWNPAKEDQATDRVYRIGQKREVHIYIPLAVTSHFKAFDEVLNNLLSRKRRLASSSLFPTEQAEVKPSEIVNDLLEISSQEQISSPLGMEDIDLFDPLKFETAVGVIWKKKKYSVRLTPASNDKGADVIAFSDDDNFLIQVKLSKTTIGVSAIGELLRAKAYYTDLYGKTFRLALVTNNILNTNAAKEAKSCGIIVNSRRELSEELAAYKVTMSEIAELDYMRSSS